MKREDLMPLLSSLGAEERGQFAVRVTVGGRVIDIDSRYTWAHDRMTSMLMLGKRADPRPDPVRSANPASPDFDVEEEPPFTAKLAEPLEGESAKPEPQAFTMPDDAKPGIDLPDIPDWLNHPAREKVEGN